MTLTTGTDATEAMHFHIIYGHFIWMIASYFYITLICIRTGILSFAFVLA